MNINDLIANVKKKLKQNINTESILIEDKTFLHKNHLGHESNKFHLKITIESEELKKLNRIESNKKIYDKFKILVKKFHPDMNSGNKKFEEKLKSITLAYTQLKNTYREKN